MVTIKRNNLIKIKVLPLNALGPNKVLNSEWRIFTTIVNKKFNRLGINQYTEVIIGINNKALDQLLNK